MQGADEPDGGTDPTLLEGQRSPAGLRLARRATRVRTDVPLLFLDVALASSAYALVLLLRFDGRVPSTYWSAFRTFLPVALLVTVANTWVWGLYGQLWRHASVAEARRVLLSGVSSGTVLVLADLVALRRTPLSVVVFGSGFATMFIGLLRFHSRLFAFHRSDHSAAVGGLRVVLVGAGGSGAAMVREMRRSQGSTLRPVAIVDDDPRKQGLFVVGVRVVGRVEDLAAVVRDYEATEVLLAIPSASKDLIQRVAAQAEQAEVSLKVLPAVREIFGGQPSVRDVRDLRIEDLLGREQVVTDLDAVRRVLAGRVVLVTGGGGSIGSEICRQVAACGPARLLMLDHDETHLHDAAAALGFDTAALGFDAVQVLADIRDPQRLNDVFARYRPEVVFHAAAHKHVPLLESYPCEAVKTNIGGTRNLVEIADRYSVERFVFISTDKAVRPSSMMGATKRLGEQLVMSHAPSSSKWSAVRFGNVLGSRGSVIPTFSRQIAQGGPVTVTDLHMTRFFMSVHEAVQLVLQAAALSQGGEVFMLDMGEPVNILELAERMIRLTGRTPGRDIEIRVTGARPGEKLVEELRAPHEVAHPTLHPAIVHLYPDSVVTEVLDIAVGRLLDLAHGNRDDEASRLLFLAIEEQAEGSSADDDARRARGGSRIEASPAEDGGSPARSASRIEASQPTAT